jgi:hypothetical protein
MRRMMTWLFVCTAIAALMPVDSADAAWRRRAWRRGYSSANCCNASYNSYNNACDAGPAGQAPANYDQQYGAPPSAPAEPADSVGGATPPPPTPPSGT